MPYEVTEPTFELHKENRFYRGDLVDVIEEDGKFGPQLKWFLELDEDDTFTDDEGTEHTRQVWAWTSSKLTTHERNSFRKFVKGLTGKEPQKGEMFDERRYTRRYYEDNPDEIPDGSPWRVAVMFQHTKKADGTPNEKVSMLVSEAELD